MAGAGGDGRECGEGDDRERESKPDRAADTVQQLPRPDLLLQPCLDRLLFRQQSLCSPQDWLGSLPN
ncbi:hypothetical protein QJS04_geneDACA005951 [Acorus gramineus]|uniref:Uncharacterized protein n=1 Tax=Acorus gramineus TaxID=55184 RepID=A0AAV9B2Z3_ACOGR|nr:hypothetical protein QJS04_geneDACA005951 [Acorus gramineus]